MTGRTLRASWALLLASMAAAAHAQYEGASGRRPDDLLPPEAITVDWFGKPTELSVQYETSAEKRRNFDLDRTAARDRVVVDHELKVGAKTRLTERVTTFVQVRALADQRKTQGSTRDRREWIERGQMWARIDGVAGLPLSLQVGRAALIERRSWWWDEDLDLVRLGGRHEALKWESGIGREVARLGTLRNGVDPAARGVNRWFGQASWSYGQRQSLDVFWLVARDRSGVPGAGTFVLKEDADTSDVDGNWIGLRAGGEFRSAADVRLRYRVDAAAVHGRDRQTGFGDAVDAFLPADATTEQRLHGGAVDASATLTWAEAPLRPSLTLGIAQAGAAFRQTGLQENKGRVSGVKRLRYYGELLNPELANLRVDTLAVGMRFLENSSGELLLHRYRQRRPGNLIAGSRLSADPEGTSGEIGREWDLYFAWREWRHAALTLSLSRFEPGAAFAVDQRDPAHGIELGLDLSF